MSLHKKTVAAAFLAITALAACGAPQEASNNGDPDSNNGSNNGPGNNGVNNGNNNGTDGNNGSNNGGGVFDADEPMVRLCAISAVASLGDEQDVPRLRELLEEGADRSREARLLPARQHPLVLQHAAAVALLGPLGPPDRTGRARVRRGRWKRGRRRESSR